MLYDEQNVRITKQNIISSAQNRRVTRSVRYYISYTVYDINNYVTEDTKSIE